VKAQTTLRPDLAAVDWQELHGSTPKGLRRPTPQTYEGCVALAAALLCTHLLYESDVKVILQRRLRCSAYTSGRFVARARALVYARAIREKQAELDDAAAPPAGAPPRPHFP
jgi:hypothetical protein